MVVLHRDMVAVVAEDIAAAEEDIALVAEGTVVEEDIVAVDQGTEAELERRLIGQLVVL